ncbi:MAG: radical SAM family heme chaperone HemW [Clostridia bacterium]|nr:radical SAM family heme chaperone HemW [Clostridia bacterium]
MRKPLSLYIHIPFCLSKCHYCAFVSQVAGEELKTSYTDALLEEIKMRGKTYNARYEVQTIYIGGGTPSSLELGKIKAIMNTIYKHFTVKNDAEITIEVNPNTLTKEKIEEYLGEGINRFSIGVQAVQGRLLNIIGRTHSYQDFRHAVLMLKDAGVTNISADLMIGLPTQTIDDVKESIKMLASLEIKHISAYILSIEEGTRFHKLMEANLLELPDENDTIQMYNTVVNELDKRGFQRYEFSNFAQIGFRSKHNTVYWDRKPYLGLGVSAHSFVDGYRMANTDDVHEYISHITQNEIPLSDKDKLTETDAKEETIMLSLRLAEGIDLLRYEQEFGVSLLAEKNEVITSLIKNKFIVIDKNNRLRATNQGFLVMDKIISMLV